jgi:group I intron endonuclease
MKEDLDQYEGKYVVYKMIFPNGKLYVGYSSNLKRRWRNANEYKTQALVYRAIKKYGWDNIVKEVIYVYDNKEDALKKEQEVIEELHLLEPNNGYNMVPGGGDPPHGLQYVSEEGYKKMQENGKRLAKEVWDDPEKAKYVVQRMREETHKKRMMMSPEERKEKYGKHHIGVTPTNAKPILQLDLQTQEIINEYPSARQAALALGLEPQSGANIQRTARGIGKSAYGYGWRWKNNGTKKVASARPK